METIHPLAPHLFLIDLDLPREGFRRFISAWLYCSDSANLLVDPGPPSSWPALRQALRYMNISRLDAILLTHIHIDHAGGAGLVLQEYPDTRVVCHPKAVPHLVAPARLEAESRKVLGNLVDDYGGIAPIPAESLFYGDVITIGGKEIRVLETPGHAPHHLSFLAGDIHFAGEVAGVHYPDVQPFYLRPATPPVFREEIFRISLNKLTFLPVSRLCFGHYGCRTDTAWVLEQAAGQMNLWLKLIGEVLQAGGEEPEREAFRELLVQDPLLAGFHRLPEDIQHRERYFLGNSIRGMVASLCKDR